MKKLISALFTGLCLVAFQSSAQATDVTFSVGVAGNQGGYYAVGQESRLQTATSDGDLHKITEESGIFEDSHPSGFFEIGIGDNMAVGVEFAMSDIQTPQNTNATLDKSSSSTAGAVKTNTAQASFSDKTTVYIQARMLGGLYTRIMYHNVNLITEESLGTGSTYGDSTLEGLGLGIGYQHDLDDLGVFIRAEISASGYEDAKAISTATPGNVITVNNMYGAEGSIRIGKTF